MSEIVQKVLAGDRLSLTRLLSKIEDGAPEGQQALAELFPHGGRAFLIGVTGAPGTGKSSLVNQIAYHYRHPADGGELKRVAIVAVDPSSPFSGGAVLGDRIRMNALTGDAGVFIRSMASRGSLGGLASTTAGIVQAFDAAGFEIILIETVGAGQAEVDIARLAHTTVVVEAPGLGDDVQAIKAGILEIADILVVNKADRPGIEQTERALKNMLQLAHPVRRDFTSPYLPASGEALNEALWMTPIQRTVATEGSGVLELVGLIAKHREHLSSTGDLARRERARLAAELDMLIQLGLVENWQKRLGNGQYEETLVEVVSRRISPGEAARKLIGMESK
ncbi:MAG: methylmalonyl Co-A mutase-associated GTPase MeaB [Anaerolineales bacterium]|nr:methylmalonyl Co-A mutase-associated GTPase MeaB [Anaerolineales bacterium]